jgi:hypothetical protein
MTRWLLVVLGLTPAVLPAQTRVGVRGGGTVMSALAKDSIVNPFAVRTDPGPAFGFWLETALNPSYTLAAGLSTSWSKLTRHENGAAETVVNLTTWIPALTLSRIIRAGFRGYVRAGAIIYRAERRESNLFRDGASPAAILGGGLSYQRALSGNFRLVLDLGYDAHRFSTPALRSAGFAGERVVHRLSLGVGVSRGL